MEPKIRDTGSQAKIQLQQQQFKYFWVKFLKLFSELLVVYFKRKNLFLNTNKHLWKKNKIFLKGKFEAKSKLIPDFGSIFDSMIARMHTSLLINLLGNESDHHTHYPVNL